MQATDTSAKELTASLAAIEGLELRQGVPLARYNTFRIGGPAEILGLAGTLEALSRTVAEARRHGVPLQVLGLGSNVLIPDDGLRGLVLRLEGEFNRVEFVDQRVTAGAAVSLGRLARRTSAQGLLGLEALSGFPSTVGGAVVMNAGCYGTEIKDLLVSTTVVEEGGEASVLAVGDLRPGYRSTVLQGQPRIVADATFHLCRGDAVGALARIRQLNRKRRSSLPYGLPNVGSIFRNPEGHYAGQLIDECGLKGEEAGGARISRRHGNVIVNFEGAKAADVLSLMRRARRAVFERFGIDLEPEVVLTGALRKAWDDASSPR